MASDPRSPATGTLPAQQIATGAPHPLLVASNAFGPLNTSQATIVGQTFTAPQLELPVLTTFVTGGIAVTPGQLYIAFVATPELAGTPQLRLGRVHRVAGDTYAAGTARVATAYNGTVASILDARFTPVGDDFAFTATFSEPVTPSVVPEPATALLFGGGLLGLGAVTRRWRTAR